MTVKFKGKEIETVVLDLDNTMYSPEKMRKMWEEVRKALIIALLGDIGNSKPMDTEIEGKLEEWINLASIKGWTLSYIGLGGNNKTFHKIANETDRSKYLTRDSELAGVSVSAFISERSKVRESLENFALDFEIFARMEE